MWRNNQSGRTMLETLAVMAVIGMLGKGIISLIYTLYDKYKVSVITTQIKDLQDKIRLRYATVGDYASLGDDVATLIKDNVIPANMRSEDTIVHAFGSTVAFNTNKDDLKDAISGEITRYSITFKDIENKACFELLNLSWTVNETSDLYSISVMSSSDDGAAEGETFTWTDSDEAKRLPIGIDKISETCSGKIDITWIFQ